MITVEAHSWPSCTSIIASSFPCKIDMITVEAHSSLDMWSEDMVKFNGFKQI